MGLLDKVKLKADEGKSIPHPLLEYGIKENAKTAYFSGAVLASQLDDGKMQQAEISRFRRIGFSLKLSSSEIEETMNSVAALGSEEAQLQFLEEIILELKDRDTALFFLGDIAQIFGSDGKYSDQDREYISAFGDWLGLSDADVDFIKEYMDCFLADGKEEAANVIGKHEEKDFAFPPQFVEYFTPGIKVKTKNTDSALTTFDFGEFQLEMVKILPGTFLMGSPKEELGRGDNEIQHEVTLTKIFYMGKFPVQQRLYKLIMGRNPSEHDGNTMPVTKVSWDDAIEFCRRINDRFAGKLVGYRFTLPTEAQWEYACRAGSTSALYNGLNLTTENNYVLGSFFGAINDGDNGEDPGLSPIAWYNKNSESRAEAVGQKQPNAWGLYDMLGNVDEWCLDWNGDYPTHAVTDPTGATSGSNRVSRGGSWGSSAYACRSASRGNYAPGNRYGYLGFRLVLASV